MSTRNPATYIIGEVPIDGCGNISNGYRVALTPLALKMLLYIARAEAPVYEAELVNLGIQDGEVFENILPHLGDLMGLGLVRDTSKIGHSR